MTIWDGSTDYAMVLAHELGHALGLAHVGGVASTNGQSFTTCASADPVNLMISGCRGSPSLHSTGCRPHLEKAQVEYARTNAEFNQRTEEVKGCPTYAPYDGNSRECVVSDDPDFSHVDDATYNSCGDPAGSIAWGAADACNGCGSTCEDDQVDCAAEQRDAAAFGHEPAFASAQECAA